MRPASMVIGEIRAKDPAEMRLVDDDHVIQTLATHGPNEAFDVGVLPRAPGTRHDLGDVQAGDPPTHSVVVDAIPVSQQPPWGRVLGKGLDQLLGGPRGCRPLGAVDMHDATTVVREHDEDEQQSPRQRTR